MLYLDGVAVDRVEGLPLDVCFLLGTLALVREEVGLDVGV